MEDTQVNETGLQRHHRLQKEAISLDLPGSGSSDDLEKAIMEKKNEPIQEVADTTIDETPEVAENAISASDAIQIEARLRFEEETRDRIKAERAVITETARIIAESESLDIEVNLPDKPSELELARARAKLGLEKVRVRPSPETVAIEKSKRGYYIFNNLEQDDASHTVNLGGKYVIHLIPGQVHVLSEYHIKRWKQIARVPTYERVATGVVGGPNTTGQLAQQCVKTGGKARFLFEYLEEAPMDAEFGLVYDQKILDKVMPKEEVLM